MSFELDFTDTAAEDVERLIGSLPRSRQERAMDAIEAACLAFAQRPLRRQGPSAVPTLPLHFEIDGVRYYWVATYRLSEDEQTIWVTHVFRVPL